MKRAIPFLLLASIHLPGHADPSEPVLHVRFCDEVGLPDREFAEFRDAVSATLRRTVVESVWTLCLVDTGAVNPARCRDPLRPNEIVLRLRASAAEDRGQALGLSRTLKDGSGVHASLHFPPIERLSTQAGIERAGVLANIALHEVGHLLMGPGHYPVGIMQSHWSERQLDETIRRNSFFTEPQAKLIRVSITARYARQPRPPQSSED